MQETNQDYLQLKRVTRDIVAISSLSSIWLYQKPEQVAESLVETLSKSLRLEFAYVVFANDTRRIEAAYGKTGFFTPAARTKLSGDLASIWNPEKRKRHVSAFPNPVGEGSLEISFTAIGASFKNGFLIAASAHPDFPQETENVLINIAANQAFVTIQYKWGLEERVRASIELEEAKIEAERANDLKSAFLANMSHEIRTPLGVLMGFTDLIADANATVESRAQYASIIKRNGEQLSVIVNDILDLSKVESGYLQVESLELVLQTILNEVTESNAPRANAKGLKFSVTVSAEVPKTFVSDPVRVKQILMNIFSNAIKFTERGSIELTVAAEENVLFFRIRDSGIGIAPADADKLFRPFSQADISTTRKFGGTGLGLVLSKRLAGLLGGDLVLESSAPGIGSVFALSISNPQSTSVEKEHAITPIFTREPLSDLSGIRVLLVDDSPDNQQLISHFLTKKSAIVETADHGLSGLEKALASDYDVVIMDVQMPVMDGFTATQSLRERGYKQPIIALTAHAMSEVRKQCLEAGYTDYLVKPVDFRALIAMVELYGRASAASQLL